MFNDPMYVVALLLSVALLLHVLLFGRITKQDKAQNKFLADELEALESRYAEMRNNRDRYCEMAHDYAERFKGLEELAAETGEKHKKQIFELEKEKTWLVKALNEAKTERNEAQFKIQCAWHVHQVVKKGKQAICLTAIVEASDGPSSVAAFEAQMKEVKAKMRIRSKAPVFAKPVFPNI